MFDYDLLHWTTFLSAAILLNLSPGPDMGFILAHTARGGKSAGFAAMLGIWVGAFCHVLMAALGLTAILATLAVLFSVVKWIGAIYLVWVGIRALRSEEDNPETENPNHEIRGFWTVFRQGILVDLLNPKVAIFFLAFLPQFVVEGSGPTWAQLFLHGTLIIVIAGIIEPPIILAGDYFAEALRRSKKLSKWLNRGIGTLFIGLGVKLALSEK